MSSTPDAGTTTTEPRLVTLQPVDTAVVQAVIPMTEMAPFFDRSFSALVPELQEQGVPIAAPAHALHRRRPAETADLEVGFAVDRPVEPSGDVVPGLLPGGTVATLVHHGSYDGLPGSWGRLEEWLTGQGLVGTSPIWEEYTTEPSPDMDPAELRTTLFWPVRD